MKQIKEESTTRYKTKENIQKQIEQNKKSNKTNKQKPKPIIEKYKTKQKTK